MRVRLQLNDEGGEQISACHTSTGYPDQDETTGEHGLGDLVEKALSEGATSVTITEITDQKLVAIGDVATTIDPETGDPLEAKE